MSVQSIMNNYYLISLAIMTAGFTAFCFYYEKKKLKAKDVVTLAVLIGIAVASRAAFAMLPFFKPMMGIIMITGICFGSAVGFLTGAVTGFVSNFMFGQGPWTPWQMLAYGVGGAVAGFLSKKGLMGEDKRAITAVLGYVIIQFIVGPILDTGSVFTMGNPSQSGFIVAIYISGIIPNAIHGAATFLTLFLFCKSMTEKLNHIKLKYGLMCEK